MGILSGGPSGSSGISSCALFSTHQTQAAFVDGLPDNYNVVAEYVLGHPHPVNLDVQGKVILPPFEVSVDGPSLELMRGTITALVTFFSRVSLVALS